MNYFEKIMLVERLKTPRYQPLNLRNERVREEYNSIIKYILTAPNWRKHGSKTGSTQLTHKS
ncbi:hypothetical protein SCG7086_AI_00120 [Chlamydiales bacterium SCGC AG-110-P3]|nr:hypothetical protein SCG7086_AI_00120 [Chlamydiales bacterium SCGC AG-110-P3]